MANLLDYLDWRGDLSWESAPFNEVDSLILTWLSYVAMDGIVPEQCSVQNAVTIEETARIFFLTHNLDRIMKETQSFTKSSALLLKRLAECKRYAKVKLSGFVNHIDYVKQTQFCAVTFFVPSTAACIVYRGTDTTLIGWKEDFNMSFLPVIPAQELALSYLEQAAATVRGRLMLAGHSKGGNLAIYAGVKCRERIRKRITAIYNNDGPGFYDLQSLGEYYMQMLPVIKTYVPKGSIIGMLLEREGEQIVVESTGKGFAQHDAMSWKVMGAGFVTAETLSEGSILLQTTIRNWLKTLEKEEREQFVDVLFELLEMTKAETVDDLTTEWHKAATAMIRSFQGLDKKTKQMLLKITGAFLKEGNITVKATTLQHFKNS